MPDKTNVINPGVPGSPDPTLEAGKIQEKEIENRVRENLRAEYDRKTQEATEALTEAQEKIAALEEKINLSAAEQTRLNTLRNAESDLEKEIKVLETDPQFRAYNEKISREVARGVKTATDEAVRLAEHNVSLRQAERLIAKQAVKENKTSEAFRKEINSIIGTRWNELPPFERVENALDERDRMQSLDKREVELKVREAALNGGGFSENGQHVPREKTMTELRGSDTYEDRLALGRTLDEQVEQSMKERREAGI